MGGYGSGRTQGANSTDDFRSIDIRRWQREGHLEAGRTLDWQWLNNGVKVAAITVKIEAGSLRLIYSYQRYGSEWESLDYPVRLQTTPCNYGGVRYWFSCPASNCGRRVAVLYLGGKIFACRHCYRLAYTTQRETAGNRANRKANKIKHKLNWQKGIAYPPGGKPKGMHWKTFWRLYSEHNHYVSLAYNDMMVQMGIVEKRLMAIGRKQ